MEPGTIMIILFFIFVVIGFFTDFLFGFGPRKIYTDAGAILLIVISSFFILKMAKDPSLTVIENLLRFLITVVIPIVLGDSAGTFISNLIKSTR